MNTDILGRPYRPARRYADGSRPYHARASCQGRDKHPCPWHAPSRHSMRTWPRVIRFDKYGMVERTCSHGIGHPDPDSVAFLRVALWEEGQDDSLSVHGCDGCCEYGCTSYSRSNKRRGARIRTQP